MFKLIKKNTNLKKKLFLKTIFNKQIKIFLVDQQIFISSQIKIKIKFFILFFEGPLGKLILPFIQNYLFFKTKKHLLFIFQHTKNKKKILTLYNKLIKIKIKGVLQRYKMILFFKGIGFKSLIQNYSLILSVGYSHKICIQIPLSIQITNPPSSLIFSSIDLIKLSQFVHFVRNHKKPEPYKGKGILFKNEKITLKEGKKNKK